MSIKRALNQSDEVEVYSSKKQKIQNGSINNDETLEQTVVEDSAAKVPKTRRDLIELPYDQKLNFVSVIAQPMAGKKLAKKLFKLMRKASKVSRKELLRIGLSSVQLRIRKGLYRKKNSK